MVRTDAELLAENDSVFTSLPVTPAAVKTFNDNLIESKQPVIQSYTTSQRDLISAPTLKDIIFNTTVGKFQYWDGTTWQTLGGVNVEGVSLVPVTITGQAGVGTYTVAELQGKTIHWVRRSGNFTDLYDFDPDLDTDNLTINGGTMLAGEKIQVCYGSTSDGVIQSGVRMLAATSTAGDAEPIISYNGPTINFATPIIDFTATPTVNLILPAGCKFICQSVSAMLTNTYLVISQPEVVVGNGASQSLFGGFSTIGTEEGDCNISSISGVSKAVTDLQAKVTAAAVAGVMEGRIIFSGVVIQDEV